MNISTKKDKKMSIERIITDREGMWKALKEFLGTEDISTGIKIITQENEFIIIYENGNIQEQITIIKGIIRVILNTNEITFYTWNSQTTLIKRNGQVNTLKIQDRIQGQNRTILKEIIRIEELPSEGKTRIHVYNRNLQPQLQSQPQLRTQFQPGRRLIQPTPTMIRQTIIEREEMNIIRRRLGEERWLIDPQSGRYVRGYIIPIRNPNERPILVPPRMQTRNPLTFSRTERIIQPNMRTTRPVQITRNGQIIPNRMIKERIDINEDEDNSETVEAKPMEIIDLEEEEKKEEEKKEESENKVEDLKKVKVQNDEDDDSATEELENPAGNEEPVKMK